MQFKNVRWLGVAAVAILSACSSTPPPQEVVTVVTPPPKPSLPYRWTNGHADKAREAALATFGEAHLTPGQYLWAESIPTEGDTNIVVDLLTQTAFVYRAEQLVGMTTISSGKKGKETPLGFWAVNRKQKLGHSNKYENAPMPFMQVIDDHGIALHGGKLPGYPASHGCVRLPLKFAEKLYGLTKVGTKVIIEG